MIQNGLFLREALRLSHETQCRDSSSRSMIIADAIGDGRVHEILRISDLLLGKSTRQLDVYDKYIDDPLTCSRASRYELRTIPVEVAMSPTLTPLTMDSSPQTARCSYRRPINLRSHKCRLSHLRSRGAMPRTSHRHDVGKAQRTSSSLHRALRQP